MALQPVAEPTNHAFRYAMRMDALAGPPGPRPLVPAKLCTCFVVHTKVNGCEALTMVDTGSMMNFVSPAFATVAKLAAFMLESQGETMLIPPATLSRFTETAAGGEDPTLHECKVVDHGERAAGGTDAMHPKEDRKAKDHDRLQKVQ